MWLHMFGDQQTGAAEDATYQFFESSPFAPQATTLSYNFSDEVLLPVSNPPPPSILCHTVS